MDPAVSIRDCQAEDCTEVLRLIRELAEYEKVPEQVKISDQGLFQDGFGQDPFYKCLVAEVPPERRSKGGECLSFSLFSGQGIGKKLMRTVAEIGLEKGCTQMKFSVLDWNQPAIDFYLGEGAVDLTAAEGWHVFRFEADAMRQLASK
nr:thialysine N-epsilon-acetyltransferase-like [Anolis sagrei ordinatus]